MSSFNIKSIDGLAPKEGKSYFFDSNVWLLILRTPEKLKPYEKAYVDFFDNLINLAQSEKCKNKPRIVINNLLVSELFNAYIRVQFDNYKDDLKLDPKCKLSKKEINNLDFKRHYRKTDNYSFHVETFKEDFTSFKDYIDVIEFHEDFNTFYLLQNFTSNVDYNDYCIYEICLENKISLITNDGDFYFQGIEIITNNGKLLNKFTKKRK